MKKMQNCAVMTGRLSQWVGNWKVVEVVPGGRSCCWPEQKRPSIELTIGEKRCSAMANEGSVQLTVMSWPRRASASEKPVGAGPPRRSGCR